MLSTVVDAPVTSAGLPLLTLGIQRRPAVFLRSANVLGRFGEVAADVGVFRCLEKDSNGGLLEVLRFPSKHPRAIGFAKPVALWARCASHRVYLGIGMRGIARKSRSRCRAWPTSWRNVLVFGRSRGAIHAQGGSRNQKHARELSGFRVFDKQFSSSFGLQHAFRSLGSRTASAIDYAG